jgi:PDZ domain-containing secreted protein
MAGSSAYSAGAASSTFDPQAHERALRKMQKIESHLGADNGGMPVYYDDDDKESSVAASSAVQSSSTGVAYDVFAPAGGIGIVVDTTDKGCIVHSLKKSSPMQGLINPGDLIIALDDFDVRKMNAASLTKLMAKKSQQPERKFTLVPSEYV